MENKQILVTGGAGFIGSHLCEELAPKNEVTVIDNLTVGNQNVPLLNELGVNLIEADITNTDKMRSVIKDFDLVFHLAAMNRAGRSIENPVLANDVNVNGTLNVLDACRQNEVPKLVFVSSSSVYGFSEKQPIEENDPLKPAHPYAVSKFAGEEYCRVFRELYGLKTVVLRYFSVYGTRQRGDIDYAAVIPKFAEAILAGEEVTVFGTGEQKRNFTYVKDNVYGTILAGENEKAVGNTYNLAAEKDHSVNEVVSTLEKITGKKANMKNLPLPPSDPMRNLPTIAKIQKELGFKEKYSFEEGLEEVVRFKQAQSKA